MIATTREIKGDDGTAHAYSVTPFTARVGVNYFGTITDAFGGSVFDRVLQAAMDGWEGDDGLRRDSPEIVALASECARRIVDRAEPAIVLELLAETERDGLPLRNEAAFDQAYRANYGELERALAFALEVNYAGFLLGRFEPARTWGVKATSLVRNQLAQWFGGLSNGSTDRGPRGMSGTTPPH